MAVFDVFLGAESYLTCMLMKLRLVSHVRLLFISDSYSNI